MESLLIKISGSIDELAFLLDQLYRFPHRERQQYYQRIQSAKNRLIQLKTNLRQNNLIHSQKIYSQVYLTVNTLKNQVNQRSSILTSSKTPPRNIGSIGHGRERKSISYISTIPNNYSRQLRPSYDPNQPQPLKENVMELLVAKEDQVNALRDKIALIERQMSLYHQRESAVKNDLHSLKIQLQQATLTNDKLHNFNTELKVENSSFREQIARKDRQIEALKGNDMSNLELCQQAAGQIKKLNQALTSSEDQILKYETLAEQNILKIKQLEDHFTLQLQQRNYTIQKHQMRQKQLTRRLDEQKIQLEQIPILKDTVSKLEDEKRRARQDANVLQVQLSESQTQCNQLRAIIKREQDKSSKLARQVEELTQGNQRLQYLNEEKEKFLRRYEDMKNSVEKQLNYATQNCSKLEKELVQCRRQKSAIEQQNKKFVSTISELQSAKSQCQHAISSLKARNQQLNIELLESEENLSRSLSSNKQLRSEIDRNLIVIKEQQGNCKKLMVQNCVLQDRQKNFEIVLVRQKELRDIVSARDIKIEQYQRRIIQLQKEYEKAKCKYLKAKIETILNIREFIV